MRTEKCKTCVNYKPQPEDQRTGREWLHATGWCELPNLTVKRRRINEDNWCDMYVEKAVPVEKPNQTIGEALEIIHADGTKTPPEFEGLSKHITDAEIVDEQTYENWRLQMHETINGIRHKLDVLEQLVDTPIGDLE